MSSSVNFFARITNLWKGFLDLILEDQEKKHPEIAYQNAIRSMAEKYTKTKTYAAAILRRREDLKDQKETKEKALAEVNAQLEQAIATNQDELGGILIQKQEALMKDVQELSGDLKVAEQESENIKAALLNFKGEIEKLKAEKDTQLARFHSAEARNMISEQLEGLSVDADIKALDTVRTHIKNTIAQANLNEELRENDLDARLKKLSVQGSSAVANQKFQAMKAAAQAKAAQADGQQKSL